MAATLPATPHDVQHPVSTTSPVGHPRPAVRKPWADALFSLLAHGAAWLTLLLLVGIIGSLVFGAAPAIRAYGLGFLWSAEWDPVND